jgi:hypothetical protein
MSTSLTNDQFRLLLGICRSAGSPKLCLAEKLINEKYNKIVMSDVQKEIIL